MRCGHDIGRHYDYFPIAPFAAVRQLRDELTLLQEPGSYVGEVVKAMGKKKVLVKARRKSNIQKLVAILAC